MLEKENPNPDLKNINFNKKILSSYTQRPVHVEQFKGQINYA